MGALANWALHKNSVAYLNEPTNPSIWLSKFLAMLWWECISRCIHASSHAIILFFYLSLPFSSQAQKCRRSPWKLFTKYPWKISFQKCTHTWRCCCCWWWWWRRRQRITIIIILKTKHIQVKTISNGCPHRVLTTDCFSTLFFLFLCLSVSCCYMFTLLYSALLFRVWLNALQVASFVIATSRLVL